MQFLYPMSRQFPVDEVCEQIVRELEKHNWEVPGMVIELDEYGPGYRMVRDIRSQDFSLHFGRVQRLMPGGHYNDIAAVSTIVIPKKEIHIYKDESGPAFYIYVGNNWRNDREKFMHSSKFNSRLNGNARTYLQYTGGCDCQATGGASFEASGFLMAKLSGDSAALAQMKHTHRGKRSPMLVHTNDLGREYDPLPGKWNWQEWRRDSGDPTHFATADVLEDFRVYLSEVVLATIAASPLPEQFAEL